jgi:hypothetical protein
MENSKMKTDRFDKIILNSYWLYRDDLITKESMLDVIDNIKLEENKRKIKLFQEETAIANKVKRTNKKWE